ncbi:hypothetical protein HPB49_004459 [Dermacentor silvarum]|uniref:Uncharacterized protein n=1 Tax=Dermacentor silvarum TaxID=543639 RepID=A0ACB8C7C3_DERSI|nr:hypothetical protein HPB49_004459 [Dermacentor silvarum]
MKLKERYNKIDDALETTMHKSIEDMRRHHNVADAEEYIAIARAGIYRPTLMLKRDCDQVNLNNFNPWIAWVLNSNVDLQIVNDITDVWSKTTVQKYEDRPEDQAALTYAENLTSFNDNGRPRAQPAVLRYHAYPLSDVLKFKREHVLLFHPFGREVDILDKNKFVEIYNCVMDILAVKARFSSPHIDLADIEELCNSIINQEVAQREAFDRQAEAERRITDTLVDANDDTDSLGEVAEGTAMQEAQGESAQAAAARRPAVQMRADVMPTNVYLQRMRMMYSGQFEIVREVIHRLTTPDSKPLQVFFTGAAGCGKISCCAP